MKTCTPNSLLVKAALAAVFTSCATVAAQTAEGTFELAFATNEDVVQLVVGDASSSELHVSTGDPGQVVVQGTVRAYSDRRNVREWVSELEANPPVVQSGSVLRIGELPWRVRRHLNTSYRVVVPPTANVHAEATSIRVEGLGGNLLVHARTIVASGVDGNVTVADAASVEIEAVGGNATIAADVGSRILVKDVRGDVLICEDKGCWAHTAIAEFDGSILASDIGGSLKVQLERD